MKTRRDVFPTKQAEFNDFQLGFIATVLLNSIAWGIPPAEVAKIVAGQGEFNPAYAKTGNKSTRTHADIVSKDDAMRDYKKALRSFIKVWIYGNTLMTDEQIVSTGLELHDKSRGSIPPPEGVPVLSHNPLPGHIVDVYFRQIQPQSGDSLRGKPKDVVRCEIVYQIGGTRPVDPTVCTHIFQVNRSPLRLSFNPSYAGQTIYLYARWVNAKNQTGGWSNLLEFIIP